MYVTLFVSNTCDHLVCCELSCAEGLSTACEVACAGCTAFKHMSVYSHLPSQDLIPTSCMYHDDEMMRMSLQACSPGIMWRPEQDAMCRCKHVCSNGSMCGVCTLWHNLWHHKVVVSVPSCGNGAGAGSCEGHNAMLWHVNKRLSYPDVAVL